MVLNELEAAVVLDLVGQTETSFRDAHEEVGNPVPSQDGVVNYTEGRWPAARTPKRADGVHSWLGRPAAKGIEKVGCTICGLFRSSGTGSVICRLLAVTTIAAHSGRK